jgi:hypothetical protein
MMLMCENTGNQLDKWGKRCYYECAIVYTEEATLFVVKPLMLQPKRGHLLHIFDTFHEALQWLSATGWRQSGRQLKWYPGI